MSAKTANTAKPTKPRRPRCKAEDNAQKAVMMWLGWQKWQGEKLANFVHHSPNGGARSGAEGANFKRMGTKAGFPDLFLFIANGGYHGLFIELKRPKTATHEQGKLEPSQQMMLERLSGQGYKAVVCYGYDETVQTIKDYLGI